MGNGDPLLWQLLLLLFFILTSGFFSCAEIALISLNKNKLEKTSESGTKTKAGRRAKRILALTGRPSKFLATIQVGSILAGFLASAFAASTISGRLSGWFVSWGTAISLRTLDAAAVVIITMILTFVQIILGELVPKRLAMNKADLIAYPISGSIMFFSRLFAPLVWMLTKSANGILRLIGIKDEADTHAINEEEIRLMIDLGSSRGTIKDGEKEILLNVFEFDNITASEVMTHRRETVMLRLDDSDEGWEKIIVKNKYSFFPVCGENHDDIVGVLNARDYLCINDRRRELVMAQAVVPAQFVPSSVRTDMLFRKMKKSRNHFAVVLDDHGSMMGIITMKDLLEELVGNLDDDNTIPPEKPLIRKTGPDTWLVSGAISLEKAARELGVTLPVERYDTFAGFAFSLLGRIPEDGTQAELEVPAAEPQQGRDSSPAQGLKIKLLEIRERRLEKALVTRFESRFEDDDE